MAPADPPVPRCWPWTHQWSKWIDASRLTLHSRLVGNTEDILESFIKQERRCERCGRLQLRRVRE